MSFVMVGCGGGSSGSSIPAVDNSLLFDSIPPRDITVDVRAVKIPKNIAVKNNVNSIISISLLAISKNLQFHTLFSVLGCE